MSVARCAGNDHGQRNQISTDGIEHKPECLEGNRAEQSGVARLAEDHGGRTALSPIEEQCVSRLPFDNLTGSLRR